MIIENIIFQYARCTSMIVHITGVSALPCVMGGKAKFTMKDGVLAYVA